MDGRYKLIIKDNKLFVRDDKNILFKDQKPSTIYIKKCNDYVNNTNYYDINNNDINNNDHGEFKNNITLVNDTVNININESETQITI